MQEHIQKLVDEAKTIKVNSVEYWKLRATYLQRVIDPTYSEQEKENCLMLHRILERREVNKYKTTSTHLKNNNMKTDIIDTELNALQMRCYEAERQLRNMVDLHENKCRTTSGERHLILLEAQKHIDKYKC